MRGKSDRTCAAARAVRALAHGHREERRQERARRAALMLRGLEADLFGHRMPCAAEVIARSGWRRDPVGAWCTRCGGTLLRCERPGAGCGECRGSPRVMAGVVRLGRYAPPLSQWAPAIKLRAWTGMGRALGQELGRATIESVSCGFMPGPEVIVPVPVHWLRRLSRGIDHAALLAEEVARVTGVPSVRGVRARLFPRQTGGDRSARAERRGRFACTRASRACRGAHVLLIDDVLTTGATGAAIAAHLIAHGARSVSMAACAVADRPRRRGIAVPDGCIGGPRQDVDNF